MRSPMERPARGVVARLDRLPLPALVILGALTVVGAITVVQWVVTIFAWLVTLLMILVILVGLAALVLTGRRRR